MFGCLRISSFPLACELADRPELAGSPAAVVGDDRVVLAVSGAAEAAGIHPGQRGSEALGRCQTLVVFAARPMHYEAVWQDVLRAVERVAFMFEPADQGLLRVDVGELLDLYGSLGGVTRALLGCAPAALQPRFGVGPTRLAALLAARQAGPGGGKAVTEERLRAFLAAQPVQALPMSAEMLRRLRGLGLGTLGELAALPRSALAAQFGLEGALTWDQAQGRDRDPLRPPLRVARLTERLRLEAPLASRLALLAAWEQTLASLTRQPGFHGLVARQAQAAAATERGQPWSRVITFKEPLGPDDRRRIWSALQPALELAEFPGPLSEVALELRGLEPAVGRQLALPSARSALRAQLEDGLRQLKARYGYCPVGRVVEVEPWSRMPERRLALIDFDP